jgi:hypothetical protein
LAAYFKQKVEGNPVKKLILFIHGLGGSKETWGQFPVLIENDEAFKGCDVDCFIYDTSLIELSSIASLTNKAVSIFSPRGILAWISKALTIGSAKSNLPKIQKVADLLKSHITLDCEEYEEIYLIAHSMGGLVARQYLNDMILSQDKTLKVKKLMLYAVPNNGSALAKVSHLYGHTQIKQLNADNDFIDLLNRSICYVDNQEIKTRYILGLKDIAVDAQSAIGEHSNRKFSFTLNKTHFDIVKPVDKEDKSFKVLKMFIVEDPNISIDEVIDKEFKDVEDVKDNPFIEKIHKTLQSKKLITLFSQDFTVISAQQAQVKQKMQYVFKENFYHLRIPKVHNNTEYFELLAQDCVFDVAINSIDKWSRKVHNKLTENSGQKTCFYITDIEDGDEEINLEFAQVIRSLQDEFTNFYVIFIGRKKLASLVYGKNSKLSPLNISEKIFFDNNVENINANDIRQELEQLKGEEVSLYLDDEVEIQWIYYSTSVLNTLFWRNIMLNHNGWYRWRDEEAKQIAKEVFYC